MVVRIEDSTARVLVYMSFTHGCVCVRVSMFRHLLLANLNVYFKGYMLAIICFNVAMCVCVFVGKKRTKK